MLINLGYVSESAPAAPTDSTRMQHDARVPRASYNM